MTWFDRKVIAMSAEKGKYKFCPVGDGDLVEYRKTCKFGCWEPDPKFHAGCII
jgi:hypothetical protein